MKKVGVTGAAGFIGSHLCERLLADGYEVVGVDDLSYGSIENVAPFIDDPKFRFEKLDCTRVNALRMAFAGCDAIMHLAAKKIPRFGGVVSTLEVNVEGAHSAAMTALALDADLILTSTSDVYGNAEAPFREDGEIVLGPSTTKRWSYAVSKLYDEHLGLALAEEQGLKVTILRLFNVYGPRNHLSWWGGPMVTFPEAILDGEPMEIHGDGLQTRTFTYVSDTVDAFVRALERPESRGEIVNVGATATISMTQLAERIQTTLGVPMPLRATFVPYETLPGKYQDVRHRVPDITKAKSLLGFEAQIDLDEGLRATLDWHQALRIELDATHAVGR
jgi:nucleoside-diphosphate-sugar epimerase